MYKLAAAFRLLTPRHRKLLNVIFTWANTLSQVTAQTPPEEALDLVLKMEIDLMEALLNS